MEKCRTSRDGVSPKVCAKGQERKQGGADGGGTGVGLCVVDDGKREGEV